LRLKVPAPEFHIVDLEPVREVLRDIRQFELVYWGMVLDFRLPEAGTKCHAAHSDPLHRILSPSDDYVGTGDARNNRSGGKLQKRSPFHLRVPFLIADSLFAPESPPPNHAEGVVRVGHRNSHSTGRKNQDISLILSCAMPSLPLGERFRWSSTFSLPHVFQGMSLRKASHPAICFCRAVGLNRLAVVEGASRGGLDFDWLCKASMVVASRLVLFMLV
jgi:hypothetical protein